jgi:hypothetical protein
MGVEGVHFPTSLELKITNSKHVPTNGRVWGGMILMEVSGFVRLVEPQFPLSFVRGIGT